MKTILAIAKGAALAALVIIVLESCADYPVALRVEGNHGVYSYSSKSGFAAQLRIISEK